MLDYSYFVQKFKPKYENTKNREDVVIQGPYQKKTFFVQCLHTEKTKSQTASNLCGNWMGILQNSENHEEQLNGCYNQWAKKS